MTTTFSLLNNNIEARITICDCWARVGEVVVKFFREDLGHWATERVSAEKSQDLAYDLLAQGWRVSEHGL